MKAGTKKHQTFFYRLNQNIKAPVLRIIGDDGRQIGIMSRDEAIEEAVKRNVDLVEIAPNASPPVAKLIDFKKFLYQQKKKKREEKKSTSKGETKEIRLGLFISEYDLETKLRKVREFFEDGNKVKITLIFKGRQLGHKNLGEELLQKVLEKLKEEAKVEREIKMEGRQMTVLLSSIKH